VQSQTHVKVVLKYLTSGTKISNLSCSSAVTETRKSREKTACRGGSGYGGGHGDGGGCTGADVGDGQGHGVVTGVEEQDASAWGEHEEHVAGKTNAGDSAVRYSGAPGAGAGGDLTLLTLLVGSYFTYFTSTRKQAREIVEREEQELTLLTLLVSAQFTYFTSRRCAVKWIARSRLSLLTFYWYTSTNTAAATGRELHAWQAY